MNLTLADIAMLKSMGILVEPAEIATAERDEEADEVAQRFLQAAYPDRIWDAGLKIWYEK